MKKKQHYVWREYLRGWAKNEHIFCLRNGSTFHPNLLNIAQENYFYQLEKVSYHDSILIRKIFVDDQPKLLQKNNEEWLRLYNYIFYLQESIKKLGKNTESLDQLINNQIKTLGEEIHTLIEHIGIPLLNQLRQKRVDFTENEIMHFYYFISEQYFRTKSMKKNFTDFHSEAFDDFSSCWGVCAHLLATNLAYNMYRERNKYELLLLNNDSKEAFITGDQPIINTYGSKDKNRTLHENEFELFYPLKPDLALLISNKIKHTSTKIHLSTDDVANFNRKIIDASFE